MEKVITKMEMYTKKNHFLQSNLLKTCKHAINNILYYITQFDGKRKKFSSAREKSRNFNPQPSPFFPPLF